LARNRLGVIGRKRLIGLGGGLGRRHGGSRGFTCRNDRAQLGLNRQALKWRIGFGTDLDDGGHKGTGQSFAVGRCVGPDGEHGLRQRPRQTVARLILGKNRKGEGRNLERDINGLHLGRRQRDRRDGCLVTRIRLVRQTRCSGCCGIGGKTEVEQRRERITRRRGTTGPCGSRHRIMRRHIRTDRQRAHGPVHPCPGWGASEGVLQG
jgi:hypothetical protein